MSAAETLAMPTESWGEAKKGFHLARQRWGSHLSQWVSVVCVCAHVFLYVCICMCLYVHICMCIYVCGVSVLVFMCIYLCVCVLCKYVCM